MSPESKWSPAQYERFKSERSKPFFDLLALVKPREGMRVVDLGCGTGELTRAMHEQLRARETVGLDSSETMLAKSAPFAGGGLRFERSTIEDFADGVTGGGEPFDLVLSNAALHWVEDHRALLAKLAARLAPGGQIAVQVPANETHPSHTVAIEVAREEPFATALRGFTRVVPNLAPEEYASLLDRLGLREQDVTMRVYGHHLGSRDDVVEWVKGSTLTDYEKRMPPELWKEFLVVYRERLLARLEDARPYFFPFKRILFWGARGKGA
jgi:trans-aconitate 2-methyltransferase